jgi:hypothetical protein
VTVRCASVCFPSFCGVAFRAESSVTTLSPAPAPTAAVVDALVFPDRSKRLRGGGGLFGVDSPSVDLLREESELADADPMGADKDAEIDPLPSDCFAARSVLFWEGEREGRGRGREGKETK